MAKLVSEKKDYIMFAFVLIITGITYLIGKDRFFGGYSSLKDFIIEESAISGLNKTGEWNFFWILLVMGCILCVLSFLWTFFCVNSKSSAKSKLTYLPIFFPALLKTIVYGEGILYLWLFSGMLYVCLRFFQEKGKKYAAYFLFLYFDGQFLAFLVSRFRNLPEYSDLLIFGVALVLSALTILYDQLQKDKDSVFAALLLTMQFPLPLLLLLYTKIEYKIGDQTRIFPYPVQYLIWIFGIILFLYVILVFEYRSATKRNEKKSHAGIYVSSIISIFLFTSFIPGVMAVQSDMHHHGEQLLPWQQIVNLGSRAFVDYFPVSGLFSMLIGGVNQLFFGNKATTYAISFIIVFMIFAILTVILMRISVDAYWTLLFAFVFQMPAYCRTWVILPALLLMLYATKKKNIRQYLYIYVFSCFLAGLYYPLFGFALVLAGMPYAVVSILDLKRNHKIKRVLLSEVKNKWFTIKAVLLVIPICISIPLLIHMAKHVLTYQGQTLLADGLPLLSTSLPEWFMAWGKNVASLDAVREACYYGLRFIGPMIPVWGMVLLLCRFVAKKMKWNTSLFFGLTAPILTLVMSYRYTVVIQDEDWVSHLFSRSSHVLLWVMGIFVPIILINYGRDFLSKEYSYVLVSLCISMIMICFVNMKDYQFPVLDGATNLSSNVIGEYAKNYEPYKLSENMIEISDKDSAEFPNLGSGFIDIQVLSNLYSYKGTIDYLKTLDPDLEILGLNSSQMYYFLLNEKAVYSGKPSLAKGKKAADMVTPFINEHVVVGTDINPFYNYYICKELKKQGFIYEDSTGFYISKDLYIKLYGEEMYNASLDALSPWSDNRYIVKTASTLGANMRYLYELLEPLDMTKGNELVDFCQVNISREHISEFFGCDISDDTYISISWDEQVRFVLDFDNGKWLLPLGMNSSSDTINIEDVKIGLYDGANGCEVWNMRLVDLCDDIICYALKK